MVPCTVSGKDPWTAEVTFPITGKFFNRVRCFLNILVEILVVGRNELHFSWVTKWWLVLSLISIAI